jgi:hypothetical protein
MTMDLYLLINNKNIIQVNGLFLTAMKITLVPRLNVPYIQISVQRVANLAEVFHETRRII